MADSQGAFHVHVESPLAIHDPDHVDGSIRAIVQEYSARLEPDILSYPELWRAWSKLRFE